MKKVRDIVEDYTEVNNTSRNNSDSEVKSSSREKSGASPFSLSNCWRITDLNILSYGITDIGFKRKVNEEFFVIIDETSGIDKARALGHLFAVADGMGGHAAGDVASKMACETILDYYDYDGKPLAGLEGATVHMARLKSLFLKAHETISRYSEENIDDDIMGTTLSALVLWNDSALIAHIGDSRIYLMREDRLIRLTEDDTGIQLLVESGKFTREEAAIHPMRHVLVQALGVDIDEIHTSLETAILGDQFLLCSDGLHDAVNESVIKKILSENGDPEVKCRKLVDTALENGGKDNVTGIVVRIMNKPIIRTE